ncbi:MAG: hypothetical protein OEX01_04045 [Candidatus Bathyarchaeota archaeon]|nr:hypothetical protein [Candidatus Bathyarchaeota archaeon]
MKNIKKQCMFANKTKEIQKSRVFKPNDQNKQRHNNKNIENDEAQGLINIGDVVA